MSGNQPKSILKKSLDDLKIDPLNSTAAAYQNYVDALIEYFQDKTVKTVKDDYPSMLLKQFNLIDHATALLNMLDLDEPLDKPLDKKAKNQEVTRKKAVQACIQVLVQYRASNPSALIDVPPKILEQHPELKAKTLVDKTNPAGNLSSAAAARAAALASLGADSSSDGPSVSSTINISDASGESDTNPDEKLLDEELLNKENTGMFDVKGNQSAARTENEDKEVDEAFAFLDKDYPEEPLEAEPAAIAVAVSPPPSASPRKKTVSVEKENLIFDLRAPSLEKNQKPASKEENETLLAEIFLAQKPSNQTESNKTLKELLLEGNQAAWESLINFNPKSLQNMPDGIRTKIFQILDEALKEKDQNVSQFLNLVCKLEFKKQRPFRDSNVPFGTVFVTYIFHQLAIEQSKGKNLDSDLPKKLMDIFRAHFMPKDLSDLSAVTKAEEEILSLTNFALHQNLVAHDLTDDQGVHIRPFIYNQKGDLHNPRSIFGRTNQLLPLTLKELNQQRQEVIVISTFSNTLTKDPYSPFFDLMKKIFAAIAIKMPTIEEHSAALSQGQSTESLLNLKGKTKRIFNAIKKVTEQFSRDIRPEEAVQKLFNAMNDPKSTLYTAIHSNRFFHKKTDRAIETTMNTILANQLKLMPASAATAKTPPPRAAGAGTSPLGIGSRAQTASAAAEADPNTTPTAGS